MIVPLLSLLSLPLLPLPSVLALQDASEGAPLAASRPAVAELSIHPPQLALRGAADVHGFVVQARLADGTTRDVTTLARATLRDPALAALDGATVAPLAAGATELQVEWEGAQAVAPIRVEAPEETRPVRFRLDVMPVLTKGGCNSGPCHGSALGQDGFRLSLFGFDPDGDHFRITRQLPTRRVNLALPEESLLLQKAAGKVAHTGGQRVSEGDPLHRTLLAWLEAGAPADPPGLPTPLAIDLYPPRTVLEGAGSTQALRVVARYSDGSDRDVTHLSAFFSSADSVAAADKVGRVTAGQRGEAFVMARFATFTIGVPIIVLPAGEAWTPTPRDSDQWPADWIDSLVAEKHERLRLLPSPRCDDATFLRRAWIDVVGLLPPAADVERFLADPAPDKRERLIDALLSRKEFSELWVMKFAELLQMRTDENNRVPYKSTLLYFHWLEERLARNVPFDQVVRELLTASGGTFKSPAANFFQVERDTLKLTENVAQVFLGMRIQCAQCHNHPFDRWTMDDYYGFAAFFAQVGRKNAEDPRETIVFDARGGEVNHPVGGRAMAPKFLGGATPDVAGRDRRAVLAEWLTARDNPWFAKNLVNLVWSHFFGVGIVEPVDDARVSNPPANPELLDELARRFVEWNYDFKRLVREICTSQAWQRATEVNGSNALDERNASHALVRRMRAEVLLDAIHAVTGTAEKFPGLPLGARAVQIADGNVATYFLTTFGRASRATVCSCEVKMEPSLSQALHLLNGDTTSQRIREGGRIRALLAAGRTPAEIVRELWLSCLARPPSEEELADLLAALPPAPPPAADGTPAAPSPELEAALEDLFWALLNSKEFVFNH
ncbi:MAG: DUF1553 domain-containing protein [Planctomycetes bacterium]|nr:DUF1553 domain-containing protein [Planctomycetota bacterium]